MSGLYNPFIIKKVKVQMPIIIKVQLIGHETRSTSTPRYIGFESEAQAGEYGYSEESGVTEGAKYMRFTGKTNAKGTWMWGENWYCKHCKKKQ